MSYVSPRDYLIARQMIDAIEDEKAAIWIWGEIRYRDAFKVDRFTKFRFIHEGKVVTKSKGIMVRDGGGNEAT